MSWGALCPLPYLKLEAVRIDVTGDQHFFKPFSKCPRDSAIPPFLLNFALARSPSATSLANCFGKGAYGAFAPL